MPETTTYGLSGSPFCGWCSNGDVRVIHQGPCPRVKSLEYHPNGTLKRVEFTDGSEGFDNMDDFINTLPEKKGLPHA